MTTWPAWRSPGALKNVHAIAVGMGYSLGIGENTRAMVMTRRNGRCPSWASDRRQRDTFAGLAGMGDLIVTCTSKRSRKPPRRRGTGLRQDGAGDHRRYEPGRRRRQATASVIMEFADKYGITMPIAREVDQVVNHGATVEQAYRGLMARKPGHEVDGTAF